MHADADPPALLVMVHVFKGTVFIKLAKYESNAVLYSLLRIFNVFSVFRYSFLCKPGPVFMRGPGKALN